MIDVTKVDMVLFVKRVYELSRPQGMGFLHYTTDPLTDEEAKGLIQPSGRVSMDYVKGRSCKMVVFVEGDKKFIRDTWYDHTESQLRQLLLDVGIVPSIESTKARHGTACNCDDCKD
jgi:hypothetical protein